LSQISLRKIPLKSFYVGMCIMPSPLPLSILSSFISCTYYGLVRDKGTGQLSRSPTKEQARQGTCPHLTGSADFQKNSDRKYVSLHYFPPSFPHPLDSLR